MSSRQADECSVLFYNVCFVITLDISNRVTTNNGAYALVAMTTQFFCTQLVFADLSAVCMRAHLQCGACFLCRDVCPDSVNARCWRCK